MSTTGASGPVSESPAATPSLAPEPTLGPVDRSDPTLGIVFASLPDVPQDTPDAADLRAAIDTYTGFEQEFWRTLVTNELSIALPGLADEGVVGYVQRQMDPTGGVHAGGVASFAVTTGSYEPTTTILDSCEDFTGAWDVGSDGTTTPYGTDARYRFSVTLTRDARGEWIVTGYEESGTC